jgi:hypothetical protein
MDAVPLGRGVIERAEVGTDGTPSANARVTTGLRDGDQTQSATNKVGDQHSHQCRVNSSATPMTINNPGAMYANDPSQPVSIERPRVA